MDANGLRFWMLADECDWLLVNQAGWWRTDGPGNGSGGGLPGSTYDPARRSMRLVSRSQRGLSGMGPVPTLSEALSSLELIPQTRDGYGTCAHWNAKTGQVVAAGALPGSVPILTLPAECPTDLAMGHDGVLYLALDSGALILLDRRNRWDPVRLAPVPLGDGTYKAWRLAADPAGGVWVLDRVNRRLARLQGLPFPERPFAAREVDVFRPCEENPNPPRLTILGEPAWASHERPVAIACSQVGRVAILSWIETTGETRLRMLSAQGEFGLAYTLNGVRWGYSLAWVSEREVAVLIPGQPVEALVYRVGDASGDSGVTATSDPVGDLYPLRDHDGGPFMHGIDLPPYYPTAAGGVPLHHLSLPSFAARGRAVNARPLDSGTAQTVWHRLYLEADIPPQCGVRVYLAASDDGRAPAADEDWYEHRFGNTFAAGARVNSDGACPQGAWVPGASELPFQAGLLKCPPVKDRSGLFTALVQRSTRRVSTLRGRYLHLRVELCGDSHASPEVAALRAYASRFSYVQHYLPALYHETLFGPDADERVASTPQGAVAKDAAARKTSTPADFLERFLCNFEGVLTPLEDRISGAYLLTDPRTTPQEALEWLGSWIGVSFDPAYPPARRRLMLQNAPRLFHERGTLRGLADALDVATGGAVSRGQIFVLENWRLRRTFATILGADLADEDDPLLQGLVANGNSYVGDTLFLGDEHRQEFMSLFAASLPKTASEEAAIAALYDKLAFRVTVLVHQEAQAQDLGLIRRVVDLETPAHVEVQVLTASWPFMVGLASLVGVDSFLAHKREPQPVRVGLSSIGVRDLLMHPPSLDPRLETGQYGGAAAPAPSLERPVADAGAPLQVDFGRSFDLDASASRAAPGYCLVSYVWTLQS